CCAAWPHADADRPEGRLNRGDVAVCIVGAGPGDTLRAHTSAGVPILEVDSEADAFDRTAPADVVVLRPGCRVAPGWLEALRAAAYADGNAATATALTQHDLGGAPPDPFEPAAAAVHGAALRLRPRLETPGDACVYVRRSALELIGGSGEGFRTRCAELGLAHVLADDVLVLDPAPPTP